MLRKLNLVMLLVMAALLCALPVAAAEFSADVLMNGGGHQMTGKIYVKGDNQRMEMNIPGGKVINIVNLTTGKMYTLMPAQKMYVEHQNLDDATIQDIRKFKDGAPPNAKKVGSETVAGYRCDVYQLQEDKDGKGKVWVSPKLKFPLKTMAQTPTGQNEMRLSNIKEGGVSDSLFKVPAGYRKFQMPKGMGGGMGGGMPGGMGGRQGR